MAMHATAAPIVSSAKNLSLDAIRRSKKFHPTVWGDHFLSYATDKTEISITEQEELERQKEMVRKLLAQTPDDSRHKLELIDAIQRVGVGYHFEKEIDKSLQYIHDNYTQHNIKDNDLHVVALRFRLLRQQGYNVPCDVFSKFIDHKGNFEESLKDDVEGMLSLYEAAYFGQHGEEILDKAIEFSSSHLESSVHQISNISLLALVNEALTMPIRKSLNRLGVRKFVSIYQEDESHNKTLLDFAKLDFNMVQKIHQKELSDATRWWMTLDVANKFPYARDRIVECYFWIVGVYFEPHYNTARRMLTKVIAAASILDDTYEYGTLDELQLLTDAIQCWDVNALEESPPHIRLCCKMVLDVYAEIENEMAETGRSYRVQYAIEDMKELATAYFEEAKWLYNNYIPTMEEYMKVALVSCGYKLMSTNLMVGMADPFTKEDFDWVSNEPLIVRAISVICRLMDDLVGEGYEDKTSAVHCYMNQYGVSKMEAFAELRQQVVNAWKDINQECLEPRAVSVSLLMRIDNLGRVINLLYSGDDGYANSINTKDLIKYVFVEPAI